MRCAPWVLLLLAIIAPGTGQAAESYDNCTGYVDSLPAVITTQGTWCLRQDVSTALSSGTAITINANNVTLDCNDFKIGGLAAGAGTASMGVQALGRSNVTIRNCTIRGFLRGVRVYGAGAGNLVESNRLEGNLYIGIQVNTDNSVVRGNQVLDTGGSNVQTTFAYGIHVAGEALQVVDNTVMGVSVTDAATGSTWGIFHDGIGNGDVLIEGNWVQGLTEQADAGAVTGIHAIDGRPVIRGNTLHGPLVGPPGQIGSLGIYCGFGTGLARENVIYGFNSNVINCATSGNVTVAP